MLDLDLMYTQKQRKKSIKGGRHGSIVKIPVPEDPGLIPRTHTVPEPTGGDSSSRGSDGPFCPRQALHAVAA